MADATLIQQVVTTAMTSGSACEIGVHLHSTQADAIGKILAAYDAGCRRFDSALGGLGGCPFAQDALVGNIATEKVIEALTQRGAASPPLKPLDALLRATAGIGARYMDSVDDD